MVASRWSYRALLCFCGLVLPLLSWTTYAASLLVKIETETTGEPGRPIVSGKTNLPNGTVLMISIEGKSNYYGGGARAIVENGRFSAGPLYNASSPMKPGTYSLEIVTPFVDLQPAEVRKIMGNAGANLAGPLVRRRAIGNVVEYRALYTLGGAQGVRTQRDATKEASTDAQALIRELVDALDKGALLLKGNPSDLAIGEHTKRVNALVDKVVRSLRQTFPECASAGSAARPYWWEGMVGLYNKGRSALQDYDRLGADYREQLRKCRATLPKK
jgi:hypothetical protein